MKCRASLLLVALLALTGCTAGVRHIGTVSVVSAHSTLSAIQDTSDAAVCGQPTAAPAPKCLTTAQRKAIAEKLSPAFAADIALAKAIRDWPIGTPQPAEIGTYLTQISVLINQILSALPDSPPKVKLMTMIGGK